MTLSTAAYTITVNGVAASPTNATLFPQAGSVRLDDTMGQRSVCDFVLIDTTAANHFNQGQRVIVTDSTGVTVWSGFVNSSKEKRVSRSTGTIAHTITCVDNLYLADKRLVAKSYSAQSAGAIVNDLVANYLAAEGVVGNNGTAAFARTSIAYRNDNGAQIAANFGRYEAVGQLAGTSALRIEEGTTNILTANESSVETDTTGFSANNAATLTRDTTTAWSGSASLKTVTANATAFEGWFISLPAANFAAGQSITASCWVKGSGTVAIGINQNGPFANLGVSAPVTLSSSTWQRISLSTTLSNPLGGTSYAMVVTTSTQQSATFWSDGMQWEAKGYPTTWQIGGTPRAAEVFTLPAAGMFGQMQGTFEMRVYFDATVRRVLNSTQYYGFCIGASCTATQSFAFYHDTFLDLWLTSMSNSNGAGTTHGLGGLGDSGGVHEFPNGWHHLAWAWDSASLLFYIDGVQKDSITSPNIPNPMPATFYFGSSGTSTNFLNTLYQDVRVYARKRTASEIAADAASATWATTDDTTVFSVNLNDQSFVHSSTIDAGPTVNEATFSYAQVSQCIDKMAEVSTKWWNIDANNLLHFRDKATYSAPSAITDSIMDEMHGGGVSVERTAPLYRNTQYLIGGTGQTSSQTETRKGDGNSRAFTMSYPLSAVPSSLTVNGVGKTLGIKGASSGKDWYWAQGDAVLTQDTSGAILGTTDTLSVTYIGSYPLAYVASDTGQIAAQQTAEGGATSGTVESVDTQGGTTSATSSAQYAAAKLARFAQGGLIVTFDTRTSGFKSGQLATVTLAAHGISAQQMLIEQVSATADNFDIWYTVRCVSGPIDSTWLDFFVGLANQAATVDSINIGTSQTLATAAPVSESWTWTESVAQTVTACPICNTSTLCGTGVIVC